MILSTVPNLEKICRQTGADVTIKVRVKVLLSYELCDDRVFKHFCFFNTEKLLCNIFSVFKPSHTLTWFSVVCSTETQCCLFSTRTRPEFCGKTVFRCGSKANTSLHQSELIKSSVSSKVKAFLLLNSLCFSVTLQ